MVLLLVVPHLRSFTNCRFNDVSHRAADYEGTLYRMGSRRLPKRMGSRARFPKRIGSLRASTANSCGSGAPASSAVSAWPPSPRPWTPEAVGREGDLVGLTLVQPQRRRQPHQSQKHAAPQHRRSHKSTLPLCPACQRTLLNSSPAVAVVKVAVPKGCTRATRAKPDSERRTQTPLSSAAAGTLRSTPPSD